MLDVMIIGAGPAGITAALYAARAQLHAAVLEKSAAGGQLTTAGTVDNYPGLPGLQGLVLAECLRRHAEAQGALFQEGRAVKVEDCGAHKRVLLENGEVWTARAVIAATGASPRRLGVPGEDEYRGAGVSYCALCDAAFFRGREVCVIGGGETAVGDALTLARIASRVTLIHRRDRLRAVKARELALAAQPNITVRWNSVAEAIEGQTDAGAAHVTGVQIRDVTNHRIERLPVEGVFVAVGMEPVTGYLHELQVCNTAGYVRAGEDCRTDVPGLFAAGDLREKPVRQIVTAAADGASAIAAVEEYLRQS